MVVFFAYKTPKIIKLNIFVKFFIFFLSLKELSKTLELLEDEQNLLFLRNVQSYLIESPLDTE